MTEPINCINLEHVRYVHKFLEQSMPDGEGTNFILKDQRWDPHGSITGTFTLKSLQD